jgi:hypothetical protein
MMDYIERCIKEYKFEEYFDNISKYIDILDKKYLQ